MSKSKKTGLGKTDSQKINNAQSTNKTPESQGEFEQMQKFFEMYQAFQRIQNQPPSDSTPESQPSNKDIERRLKEQYLSPPSQRSAKSNISKSSSKDAKPSLARDRWLRVGKRRGEAVLYALNQLSKCANSYNYQYTSEEIDHIFEKVNKKLEEVQMSFQYRMPKTDSDDTINF